jgi:L-2-hydroxyglutarate oxidase
VLVDKEGEVATHQSGHNSGVIHSGLYYKPGSLKARLAVEGAKEMYQFCGQHRVAHRRTGKVVIATDTSEIPALDELQRRGEANGLTGLRRLGPGGITDIEPAAIGVDALHVPEAGVADFGAVARALTEELSAAGAEIRLASAVTRIDHTTSGAEVVAGDTSFRVRALVNCGGLHSDRVAALAGVDPGVRIIPFRGEYYTLAAPRASLVRALIYPVPDPRFPFLGVHFTRRFDDSVEVGPNALLALGREQYRGRGPDWADIGDVLRWPGFWRLAGRHLGSGAKELVNSKSRSQYARLARRLVPAVESGDLRPGGAGVRAQAVDRTGRLVDDFVTETAGSTVHVLNAPSPGATASLAIGRHVAGLVTPLLGTR